MGRAQAGTQRRQGSSCKLIFYRTPRKIREANYSDNHRGPEAFPWESGITRDYLSPRSSPRGRRARAAVARHPPPPPVPAAGPQPKTKCSGSLLAPRSSCTAFGLLGWMEWWWGLGLLLTWPHCACLSPVSLVWEPSLRPSCSKPRGVQGITGKKFVDVPPG